MKLFASPTSEEWLFIGIVFILVVMLIAVAEMGRSLLGGNSEITRKSVHIIAGMLMAYSPFVFFSGVPALTIAASAAAGTFAAVRLGMLPSLHDTGRKTYGTVIHPLAFFLLVLLLWDAAPLILSLSLLLLAIPDALASIVGGHLPRPHYFPFSTDKKTVEGSAVMFGSSVAVIVVFFWYQQPVTPLPWWTIAIVTAAFITAWELLCSKGWDNLFVPLGAALLLTVFLMPRHSGLPEQLVWGSVLGMVIGILSYRFSFLSLSGSIATFILGTVIYGLGGWEWTIPILMFFVSSSLLSKMGRSTKSLFDAVVDKTDKRDAGQVAANGGIAGLIVIFWNYFPAGEEWYLLSVASVAAVTADTWGTEIGTLAKGNPRSIVTLRPVATGTSGGVSAAGIFGGAAGALLIAVTASIAGEQTFSTGTMVSIVLSGIAGSLADSLAGGSIQALYRSPDGILTEKSAVKGVPTTLVRGYRFITNDAVNWLCAAAGAGTMYLLL